MGKKITVVLAVLVLGVLLAACSSTPSSFGKAHRGRSLDVTVLAMERSPNLRYTNSYPDGAVDHHRLLPSGEGNELVLIRLSVANQTATSHIVEVGDQAAELKDFFQGSYFPLDVGSQGQSWAIADGEWRWVDNDALTNLEEQTRGVAVPVPPNWVKEPVREIEVGANGTPPGQGFLVGSFKLGKGFSIDGWLVFEAPIDTEIRSLRWRAGDSITILF